MLKFLNLGEGPAKPGSHAFVTGGAGAGESAARATRWSARDLARDAWQSPAAWSLAA